MPNLGKRIRDLRVAKGLSQPQLAAKAQISQSYLWNIERGAKGGVEVHPSAAILQRIAHVLAVSIGDLVGERHWSVPAHHVVPRPGVAENLPDSLVDYITLRKARGTPLENEEIRMLAGIKYKGNAPRSVEDWDYIMQSIKRTISQ